YYIYIGLRLIEKRTKVASTARKYWGFRRFTGVCYVRQFVQDRYIKAYSMLDNLYRIAFSFFVKIECYLDIIFIFVVEIKKALEFFGKTHRELLEKIKLSHGKYKNKKRTCNIDVLFDYTKIQ